MMALALLLSLIGAWAIILIFSVSHLVGLIVSFIISIVFISMSIYINKALEKEIMREIELSFIEEYEYWSDSTDGPSLLGTKNDYSGQVFLESY